MNINKLINCIEEIAPLELGEDWDNSGIQIQCTDEVNKALVALDINMDVIDEAIDGNFDLIITHHPLLFNKPSKITNNDILGKYIIKLIKNNINVYSSHIPFDNADKGNNFYLCDLLGMKDIYAPQNANHPGMIGNLEEEININEMICLVEKAININRKNFNYVDGGVSISKIAVCTGSGGDFIYDAISNDCQLLITGEVKLHQAQYAKAMNCSIIDAGHFGTEHIFISNMIDLLNKKTNKIINIQESTSNTSPFVL